MTEPQIRETMRCYGLSQERIGELLYTHGTLAPLGTHEA